MLGQAYTRIKEAVAFAERDDPRYPADVCRQIRTSLVLRSDAISVCAYVVRQSLENQIDVSWLEIERLEVNPLIEAIRSCRDALVRELCRVDRPVQSADITPQNVVDEIMKKVEAVTAKEG